MSSTVTINLLLLGSLFVSQAAFAHKAEVKRSLMLEAWEHELHYVARVKVPARLRAGLAMQAKSPSKIKAVLAKRALDGFTLVIHGKTVKFDQFESKLNLPENPNDPIDYMLYGKLKLSNANTMIDLTLNQSAETLHVEVLQGQRPPKRRDNAKASAQAFKRKLSKGEKVSWSHARKQK